MKGAIYRMSHWTPVTFQTAIHSLVCSGEKKIIQKGVETRTLTTKVRNLTPVFLIRCNYVFAIKEFSN